MSRNSSKALTRCTRKVHPIIHACHMCYSCTISWSVTSVCDCLLLYRIPTHPQSGMTLQCSLTPLTPTARLQDELSCYACEQSTDWSPVVIVCVMHPRSCCNAFWKSILSPLSVLRAACRPELSWDDIMVGCGRGDAAEQVVHTCCQEACANFMFHGCPGIFRPGTGGSQGGA